MNSVKWFLPVLIVLASCGNPHLTKKAEVGEGSGGADIKTQIMIEKLVSQAYFEAAGSDGKQEIDFGQVPAKSDSRKLLIIKNITEKDLNFDVVFDRGTSFIFTGPNGAFPGENGTCTKILAANASCTIEIGFQVNVAGTYEDYVVVVHDDIKLTIPLSAERIVTETKPANPDSVLASKLSIGTSLDFGDVIVGSTYKKEIEINQFSETDLMIESYTLDQQKEFKIVSNGSCGKVLTRSGCKLEVSFTPDDLSAELDTLKIKDKDGNSLELSLKGSGIVAPKCINRAEVALKGSIGRISKPAVTVLPYLSSSKETTSRLTTLYGSDFNTQVKGVSIRTVKDAQVLMDFDLSKVALKNITDITVDLDVWKIISDDYKDTEMLCLTSKSFKKCSGKIFVLESWKKLLNKKFWNADKNISVADIMVNDLFQKRLSSNEKKCGETSCEVFRGEISLKELFGLTESDLEKLRADKIMTLVLADDSRFLSMPKLKFISLTESACEAK